ncbi:uncharacterized protein [Apostichopus japonicus]|uniref:uncharacterized protein n=1 Tax=Stichopus japonicus TaxID=307972 RepID=UPI003AB78A88
MEKAPKLIAEMFPGMKDALGWEILKSSSVSTNLPADSMGFWMTQGFPIGLFILHVITATLGDRSLGRCFVNTDKEYSITSSQEKYITEFCLDAAKGTNCSQINCSQSEVFCNTNAVKNNWRDDLHEAKYIPSLFVYRYSLWFLFLFVVLRAIPQTLWRLFCGADIRKGVNGVATVAEFQHEMRGASLAVEMYEGHNKRQNESSANHQTAAAFNVINRYTTWMANMKKIGLEEVEKRAKRKGLYYLYVTRKVFDILIDIVLFGALVVLHVKHDVFSLSSFVCDLHDDANNLLQCRTIPQRYVTCTVSFAMEFVISVYALTVAYATDIILQSFALVWFSRVIRRCARKLSGGNNGDKRPVFWDSFLSRELALGSEVFGNEYRALMKSTNDLYLIGRLYKQSNIHHGHFLQTMSEKILEHLRHVFDNMERNSEISSQVLPTLGGSPIIVTEAENKDIFSQGDNGNARLEDSCLSISYPGSSTMPSVSSNPVLLNNDSHNIHLDM